MPDVSDRPDQIACRATPDDASARFYTSRRFFSRFRLRVIWEKEKPAMGDCKIWSTRMTEFESFWAIYPKKVARLDAMKAYTQARRVASAEDIIAGVQRYLVHLPDEVRFIAHAGTWLRAGRWQDEYDAPIQRPSKVDWYQECAELHNHECGLDRWAHATRKQLDASKQRAS